MTSHAEAPGEHSEKVLSSVCPSNNFSLRSLSAHGAS